MHYSIDYKSGQISYHTQPEEIKAQYVIHSYDELRKVSAGLKQMVAAVQLLYETLTEKNKTKLAGTFPSFEELLLTLASLDEKAIVVEQRLADLTLMETLPEEHPSTVITESQILSLRDLEAQEQQRIAEIEAQEQQELAARRARLSL